MSMHRWAGVLFLVAGAALSGACTSSESSGGEGTSGSEVTAGGAAGASGSSAGGAGGEAGTASGAAGSAGTGASGGEAGSGGGAGSGAAWPTFTNACKNATDEPISTGADIHKQAQACGMNCIFSGGQACEVECMKKLGLSDDCSACWGAVINCGIKSCSSVCLNPDKPECMTCTDMKCNPTFHTCAGI